MAESKKKKTEHDEVKKMIKPKLKEEDLEELTSEEAYERQYYENSVILRIDPKTKLIDDILTCFDIETTMELLMLAPLEFISRTDGIENEKEYKERLWKQVRNFYRAARDMLDRRYRL